MKRVVLLLAAAAVVVVAVYWVALRGSSTPPTAATPARAVAQIGAGKRVIMVSENGRVMGATAGKSKSRLPVLPIKERPPGDRVRGHVLEEVKVVAATPQALRPYLAKVGYGETGVDVEFTSGIEVRFGDDHEAARKWKAAAAILADPSITRLSYVDVHAPTRPVTHGEEHELPPAS